MLNLILTIVLTSTLFIVFKVFHLWRINTFVAIVINYFVCVVTGSIYTATSPIAVIEQAQPWLLPACITGAVFVITFYLMALTVEKVNMTVASVANKVSLIIPVAGSLIFFETQAVDYNIFNYIGIATGIVAIVLTSIRESNDLLPKQEQRLSFILPIVVFLLGGGIDFYINYINYSYMTPESQPYFPMATFLAAALTGVVLISFRFKKVTFAMKDVAGGIMLGIPNYFTIYFLLQALSDFNNDGTIFFPVLNIGIILVTTLSAFVFFRERLTKTNIYGIFMSIMALILIFL
ncbi:hypothetical protein RCC89_16680 [Cytophagaceae bacterium ABcell3]|nr:hypothetical protein RCC89_16680 [Cytophagaceae bacterium ABcell3]